MATDTQMRPADGPPTVGVARVRSTLRLGAVQDLGLLIVLALLCAVFAATAPHFVTTGNLTNILLSVAVIGTMAAVMTLVVVGGALDLSVGSAAALAGVMSARLGEAAGHSAVVTLAVALATGAACGAVNGLVVTKLRINPIIATIGTLSAYRGLAFIVTDGDNVFIQTGLVRNLGFDRFLGLPVAVWVMLAVFAVVWWVSRFTTAGRALYAVGANPRASLLSGLRLGRARFWVLAASGTAAGLAGLLLNGQSGTAVPAAAQGYELQVLTAVLLGGTSLLGGEGRVTGTLIGVLIIGVINSGMTLLNVPSYYQTVASGALLLLAVAFDQLRRGTRYE